MGMLRFISRWLELYSLIRSALEPSSAVGYGSGNASPYASSPAWAAQSSSFSSTATYYAPTPSPGAGYSLPSPLPNSPATLHLEQRFSYEATSAGSYPYPSAAAAPQAAVQRHAPPEAAAQAYCDRCVDEALAMLDSFGDGDVEEFLPQLANLFLGCAEPSSGSSSFNGASFNRADASQGSRPPWEAWQRALAATWQSLGEESGGGSGGGDYASRGGQSQWAPSNAPLSSPASSPPLAEQQAWGSMRQRLEEAVLRRCALNPSLAVKLAWLLDDVRMAAAASPDPCRDFGVY